MDHGAYRSPYRNSYCILVDIRDVDLIVVLVEVLIIISVVVLVVLVVVICFVVFVVVFVVFVMVPHSGMGKLGKVVSLEIPSRNEDPPEEPAEFVEKEGGCMEILRSIRREGRSYRRMEKVTQRRTARIVFFS
ncbi:hypothetical protein ANN_18510 [Periplaneta americana]|uniref:Uncharacterized protein n=1 Tax=Periplaneta americana TaxID=6978 RepID=A0ABQ8SQ84_PERAM|nr:hypothetical protein ANN_18510 [Periplaneta americana]